MPYNSAPTKEKAAFLHLCKITSIGNPLKAWRMESQDAMSLDLSMTSATIDDLPSTFLVPFLPYRKHIGGKKRRHIVYPLEEPIRNFQASKRSPMDWGRNQLQPNQLRIDVQTCCAIEQFNSWINDPQIPPPTKASIDDNHIELAKVINTEDATTKYKPPKNQHP